MWIPLGKLKHVPASPSTSLWIVQLSSTLSPTISKFHRFIVYSSPSSDVSSWASSSPATPPCQGHWRRSRWRCCCGGSQRETARPPGFSPGASAAALLEAAVEAEAASGSAREAAGGTADVSAADSSATSACLETQVVVNWLETWLENHQRCGKIIEQTLMGECPICISNTRLEHRAG